MLQLLCSQLGRDELLIVASQQIGSSAQVTPGVPARQPESPAANAAGPGVLGLGPC